MTSANVPDDWEEHVAAALAVANRYSHGWFHDVPAEDGFYLEPITAYKAWSVSKDGLLGPVGIGKGLCLPKNPKPATCSQGPVTHTGSIPPVGTCTCGYYALKDPGDLIDCIDGSFFALSACHLWGRIIEHERGYRAEYCYPKGRLQLFAKGEDERLKQLGREFGDLLEFNYDIPVHLITSDNWLTDA